MDDNYDIPVERGDLLFTIEMALSKAEAYWPKKRRPGDHDRLKPMARKVVDHLELCRMRCYRRAPAPHHSIPDPFKTPRRSGGNDGSEGAPGG